LHEVEPLAARDGQRLLRGHDAELLSGVVDDAHLANPDAFVYPRAVVPPRTSVKSDNPSYAAAAGGAFFSRTSESAAVTNSSIIRLPWSPPVRLRTETEPSAASRSPATSI